MIYISLIKGYVNCFPSLKSPTGLRQFKTVMCYGSHLG